MPVKPRGTTRCSAGSSPSAPCLRAKASQCLPLRGGVYLNLITPIGLTFVAYRWFGRKVAGLALVCMIFVLCGNWPSWAVTTFSPWLFAANFAQGIFFIVVAFVPDAFEHPTVGRSLRLGAMVGVVALTHTAPAILAVLVIVTTAVWSLACNRGARRAISHVVGTVAIVSVVVSSPFWLPVAIHYRMKIRNPAPSGWMWEEITPRSLPGFIRRFVWRWPLVVMALGLIVVIKRRPKRPITPKVVALMAWTAWSAIGLVASTYRASSHVGAGLVPNIVPSYHWLLYLSAALCIWFGIAAAALADWLAARLRRAESGGAIAAVVAVAVSVPSWRHRHDLQSDGAGARAMAVSFENFRVSSWIRDHTLSTDTVAYAGPDPLGLIIVGIAGRHSLVTNELFSNPFVDWATRDAARNSIISSLERCDVGTLRESISPYGRVPFLVYLRAAGSDPAPTFCPEAAEVALETSRVVVYQLSV
jgi:hypothetical protein